MQTRQPKQHQLIHPMPKCLKGLRFAFSEELALIDSSTKKPAKVESV